MSYTYEYPHPAVTVDIVAFAVRDAHLKVLLVERGQPPFAGMHALPGGFVGIDESLKHAAYRELREETGVSAAFLEQLHTFGQPGRDPRERVISVAYVSLIPADRLAVRGASDARAAGWFDAERVPALAFDHRRILDRALRRLDTRGQDPAVAILLMPGRFTMQELRRTYEALTRRRVDKRNFSKRVRASALIEETGESRRDGAHRPAALYRLRRGRATG